MATLGERADGMDLALAVWMIDPSAEYIPTEDRRDIAVWVGPGGQPTEEELQAAWAAYLASEWPATHGYAPPAQRPSPRDHPEAAHTGLRAQPASDPGARG